MSVRPAAVAGMFYPGDAGDLSASIADALSDAKPAMHDVIAPKALIVPHAGYIYSGLTAAFAYAAIEPDRIKRVVLFGPAHRVPFYGLALPDVDAFETPLGQVKLEHAGMQKALGYSQVALNRQAHAEEHALEVQLPFLQTVLNEFELIPLCVGMVEPDAVAELMRALWGGEETIVIVSSDLSHYHSYNEARSLDRATIGRLLAMQVDLSHDQACGATAINALQMIAREKELKPTLLDYRNSGDTAGDKEQVVGYAALAYAEHRSVHG